LQSLARWVQKAPSQSSPKIEPLIHIRFVIANPSSYRCFTDYRPSPHAPHCSNWNRWKYGIGDAPEYVKLSPSRTSAKMPIDTLMSLGWQ
jgi:hypothetical protein